MACLINFLEKYINSCYATDNVCMHAYQGLKILWITQIVSESESCSYGFLEFVNRRMGAVHLQKLLENFIIPVIN